MIITRDTRGRTPMTLSLLLSRTVKVGECLEWQMALRADGYGVCWFNGRNWSAHRLAYFLKHGINSLGNLSELEVCHRCDNRKCINPDHLFLGTQKDNVTDCIQKGRRNTAKGQALPHAKLAPDEVKEIRLLRGNVTIRELARRYCVSPATISNIHNRTVWTHVYP